MADEKMKKLLSENARGIEFTDQGKLDEAESCFRVLQGEFPQSPVPLFNLAVVLVKKGQDEEALREFSAVMKLDASSADALLEIGLIHYRAGRYEKAESAYMQALEIDENDPKVLNNMGVLRFVQERYKEAETFFRQALEIDPDDEDAKINYRDTQNIREKI